jgi:CubicO group peptidase (beta-lactamase class C family)
LRRPPGESFSYANATSILLGMAVERACGMRLDRAAQRRFFGPLGMAATTFSPETLDLSSVAPTEEDPWRGRTVRGEVHDESAWALRGELVAGSAGLFSTAPDLLRFVEMLLAGGALDRTRCFRPETVRLMHTNMLPGKLGTAAGCGWELAQQVFMGERCTPAAFGKTGFTGCAIVADPVLQAGFVFLTNHTFPKRRPERDAINRVRRTIADLVFEGTEAKKSRSQVRVKGMQGRAEEGTGESG